MGKIIIKNAVVRKPGFAYYIDKEGNIVEASMEEMRAKGKKTIIAKSKERHAKLAAMKKAKELLKAKKK